MHEMITSHPDSYCGRPAPQNPRKKNAEKKYMHVSWTSSRLIKKECGFGAPVGIPTLLCTFGLGVGDTVHCR
jgi:hypothetical protein